MLTHEHRSFQTLSPSAELRVPVEKCRTGSLWHTILFNTVLTSHSASEVGLPLVRFKVRVRVSVRVRVRVRVAPDPLPACR